jgi:CBS domain-containing protein
MRSIKAILGERQTFTIERDASVASAAVLMTARQIGAVPVVDAGRLVGIFSERDLLTRVVAASRDPKTTTVGDVMSSHLIVADAREDYEACLARMQQSHVRHLIILEDGALAGIASMRDLLAADIDEKAEAITLLNAYVHYIPADLQRARPRP